MEAIMKLDQIPRRQEILTLVEAHQRLDRVLISQHFDRRVASFSEIAHVARAVWIGTLRDTPMTAMQIAQTIGMPCATVMSKLGYLMKRGYICQDGDVYRVADKVLATRTPALDRAIAVFVETADALRAIQANNPAVGANAA
jgi:hypothetical protein